MRLSPGIAELVFATPGLCGPYNAFVIKKVKARKFCAGPLVLQHHGGFHLVSFGVASVWKNILAR